MNARVAAFTSQKQRFAANVWDAFIAAVIVSLKDNLQ